MKTEQVALARASSREMKALCKMHGIDTAGVDHVQSLRALVRKAQIFEVIEDEQYIAVPVEIGARPEPMAGTAVSDYEPPNVPPTCKPFLKVEIMVAPGTETDTRNCYVSVDGRNYLIPRGEKVTIPYRFYESLSHAKKLVYAESSKGIGEPFEQHSFPFSVYRFIELPGYREEMQSPAVAAWREAREAHAAVLAALRAEAAA